MTQLLERIWPREMEAYRNDPNAVMMAAGEMESHCANCGGHQTMMVFVIAGGPSASPRQRGDKWLDLPRGRGWYQGELKAQPCPVCQAGRMEAYLSANCGLSGDDRAVWLGGFRTTGSFAGKEAALQAARALLGMDRQPAGFITFLGSYGVGKTHLLKGLVNGFVGVHVMARYTTLADLLGDIREKFGDAPRAVEAAIEAYRVVRVLCIDEIDKVSLTPWARETIGRLMDSRWKDAGTLLTVLATNTAPEDFVEDLGYLASRMRGGVVIEVAGPDVRQGQGIAAARQLAAAQPVPIEGE